MGVCGTMSIYHPIALSPFFPLLPLSPAENHKHIKNMTNGIRTKELLLTSLSRVFNTGSPFNVPAGHTVNLDKVIAHYHKANDNANKEREARNKVAESAQEES